MIILSTFCAWTSERSPTVSCCASCASFGWWTSCWFASAATLSPLQVLPCHLPVNVRELHGSLTNNINGWLKADNLERVAFCVIYSSCSKSIAICIWHFKWSLANASLIGNIFENSFTSQMLKTLTRNSINTIPVEFCNSRIVLTFAWSL